MTEDWTKWEGLIIDRVFPLRRYLGNSGHSVVFLTQHDAHDLPDAAIKLIPADPVLAEAQLSCWTIAGALSHPHLIRIFGSGRCRLGGHPFLYVVMEYAEQTLAQLLPHRALTPDEARELLLPTLDALAYLHGKNLVQGQLKPSNVLVVDDRVKLASDTVRPAGDSAAAIAEPSLYDAPEAKDGRISTAGDVWALGVTIVESLTQHPPTWPDARRENVSLAAGLPPLFADIARRCLSRYPAGRPAITGLVAQIKRAPHAPGAPVTETGTNPVQASKAPVGEAAASESRVTKAAAASEVPVMKAALTDAAPSEMFASEVGVGATAANGSPTRPAAAEPPSAAEPPATKRLSVPAMAAGTLAALVVIWICWRLLHGHPNPPHPPSSNAPSASQPAAPPPAPAQNPSTPASTPAGLVVLHQEIPDVPRHARESIRGRIKVMVHVTVDRSGNVVGERLLNSGSSRYFARLATVAAGKWKFVPTDKQGSRGWLLQFEFTRGGATGQLAAPPT
jgi:outer membrane biosynthesis protein TonB